MSHSRRNVLQMGVTAAASIVGARFTVAQAEPSSPAYAAVSPRLDQFVQQYMRDMNSPGMTLVLADRSGMQRVVAYGLGDRERGSPVRTDELFQIGSISKSFVAFVSPATARRGQARRAQTHYRVPVPGSGWIPHIRPSPCTIC